MSDSSRTTAVLAGAVIVVLALFAPWYAVDFAGATRGALGQQTAQLPGVVGEFTRGLLAVLPARIVVDGWEAFEKTDVVLLVCGLGAAFAALLGRFEVALFGGVAAVAATLLAIFDKPGPGGDLIQLQWGAWASLAGAALIVFAARAGARGSRQF
ncbi:MAG TPA: hypothetical protein VL120_07160 [Solirubrobacteraceae bacterium]|nr:hypothetical protein [Solirubrobacteraceae bacterium]